MKLFAELWSKIKLNTRIPTWVKTMAAKVII